MISWKLLFLGCVTFVAIPSALSKHVICYQGQSYWCQNITTAAECNAVKHCIHSVWEKESPIEMDSSSVCQTCMDMVKMARDQLRSNETEEELKQVLESTCMVIPEKHLKKDCDKLMDDFGAYVVDTLSSQMNPSVVCSVAGLCYNDKFKNVKAETRLNCDNCMDFMTLIEGNIENASSKDLRFVLDKLCARLGSFSIVCASLVEDHMESLDALIRYNVKPEPVCDLAGVCAEKYHSHADRPAQTEVEVFEKVDDDLPCDLCIQLVKHLKDVLIANTTEEEFKMVLDGICKMSKFKDECSKYIDQYYSAIYYFLVNELDGRQLCDQIKICNTTKAISAQQPVKNELLLPSGQPQQLPLDRMKITLVPQMFGIKKDNNLCPFCEYFLHFIQQEITLPSSEREITDVVEKSCTKLPATIRNQCESFLETYMAQFIAILANKIDPSRVCPMLGACEGRLVVTEYKSKPTCPLCLLAMEETLRKVQTRTEKNVNNVLDDLCMRDEFPSPVIIDCVKFITDFRGPITDMVIAEFTPQEACVYVDLCAPPPDRLLPPLEIDDEDDEASEDKAIIGGDVETNEIRKYEIPVVCQVCEIVMKKLMVMVATNKTEIYIRVALHKVCGAVPNEYVDSCLKFVDEHEGEILDFLIKDASPELACSMMLLCSEKPKIEQIITDPVKRCIVCEVFMDFLKVVITNDELDEDMTQKLIRTCTHFPRREIAFCESMVEQLGPQIEMILRSVPVGPLVCHRIHMCPKRRAAAELQLLGVDLGPNCSTGPEYWCATSANAVECDKIEYCQKYVWRADKAGKRQLKGAVIY